MRIGRGVLDQSGAMARQCFGEPTQRLALISNQRVFSLYGAAIVSSLRDNDFAVSTHLIGDGERYKSLRTTEKLLHFLNETGIKRTDGVIALGGGVVGDLAGFSASIHWRGVPFFQVPTTLLAQIDSSVGGKTGVNLAVGKNLVGSFHQPCGVLVDVGTLETLPSRELVGGFCECVKQGAVASRKLFHQTTNFLQHLNNRDLKTAPQLDELIADHCRFKASIVRADEREDPTRLDRRSRRILNFGHTVGHALEAVTNYRRFRHGEAVGHGMLFAGELSKNLGLLQQSELESLRWAIALCGPLPPAHDIDINAVVEAVEHDKKKMAGRLQWVLLERIGSPRIVDGAQIGSALLRKTLREVFRR